MSLIENAIDALLEADKYPPYGHDVKLDSGINSKTIFLSSGISNEFPIYLSIERNNISTEEEEKIKNMKLSFSKEHTFRDYKNIKLVAEFELKKDYIETLILDIFKNVFNVNDLSKISYKIYPI